MIDLQQEEIQQVNGRIEINLTARNLTFYGQGGQVKSYPVAIGKPSTPSPVGSWYVKNKVLNPGGVLGTRWMGLNVPWGNYGIHGTNNPASIGKAVSNGCIRMYNRDVEELFPLVAIGTTVQILRTQAGVPGYHQPGQPANPGTTKTYTVRPGDTLYKIAQKLGVTVDVIVRANQIANPNLIYPGQVLIILS